MDTAGLADALSSNGFLVAAVGFLVGATELLSRYRDNPWRALLNAAALIYILVNVAAASLALLLLDAFQALPADLTGAKEKWVKVLLAGLGAMAFFRSSLFTFRLGDKDIPLGPGLLFQVLLDVTDRAVDRARARPRSLAVAKIMSNVKFGKAQSALPVYCFALMQNVSAEEQAAFAKQVSQLAAATTMSDAVKSLALGLALINVVGDAVLLAAVESLGAEIT
jgi:hypothetical protein